MKLALLIAASSLLAGCSYTSTLKPDTAIETVQMSAAPSEETFRTILPMLRECYPINMAVESNYFPEAKEGEIAIAMTTTNVRVEFARMFISPAGTGSKVRMQRAKNFEAFDKALPAWIAGADGDCPYGTRPKRFDDPPGLVRTNANPLGQGRY